MTKTDKFEVPEPSRDAVDALRDTKLRSHSFDEVKAMASLVLRVDVPRIVRAEVERFAGVLLPMGERQGRAMEAYLAARFGEGEPKRPCAVCGKAEADPGVTVCEVCWDKQYRPTPSAPAVIGLEGGRLTSSPVYTDAERKTLKRIETFCTALAKERVVGAEGPQGLVYDPLWAARRARADDEATAAAREFLR